MNVARTGSRRSHDRGERHNHRKRLCTSLGTLCRGGRHGYHPPDFHLQPDGTIVGNDVISPPDPDNPGTFTLTYVLNGSSLDVRFDYGVENWTVENLTGSSFTLVRTSDGVEQRCAFTRVG